MVSSSVYNLLVFSLEANNTFRHIPEYICREDTSADIHWYPRILWSISLWFTSICGRPHNNYILQHNLQFSVIISSKSLLDLIHQLFTDRWQDYTIFSRRIIGGYIFPWEMEYCELFRSQTDPRYMSSMTNIQELFWVLFTPLTFTQLYCFRHLEGALKLDALGSRVLDQWY